MTSEDKGSAVEGGDLGWTGPGTFVPEFEALLAALKENEISAPFRSQFGWHIVQLLGRRMHDTTDDVRRKRAFARCARARPTRKPSCGCAACATRPMSKPSSSRPRPRIALTSGEPAGIGPDGSARQLAAATSARTCIEIAASPWS